MYDVVYVFRGILIGLMVSVPLGPMGVLIIQKTLKKKKMKKKTSKN